MVDLFYGILAKLGYTHPVHVMVTHMPVGLVTGSLALLVVAFLWKKEHLARSARHVFIVALIFVVPTIIAGLMDWIHFYNAAWIPAIKAKIILASVLLVLLVLGVVFGEKGKGFTPLMLVIYALSFLTVIGLGYFGGNLVYGEPVGAAEPPARVEVAQQPGPSAEDLKAGSQVFALNCQGCHPRGGNVVNPAMALKTSAKLASRAQLVAFIRDPKMPDGKPGDMPAFDAAAVSDADAGRLYAWITDTISKGGWR
jgi:mono/diheme cytochrome c family protein